MLTECCCNIVCGNTLGTGAVLATAQTDCDMACSGDATEACGGGNRLNLFTSGKTPPAGPDHNPGPDGWALQGCYV